MSWLPAWRQSLCSWWRAPRRAIRFASFAAAASASGLRSEAPVVPRLQVALVGLPNSGKSAIWNRLVGRSAIISPVAGTTRDRREGTARLGDLQFRLVDTSGLEEGEEELTQAMQFQVALAVQHADAILFCIDARQGVSLQDESFARWVRKHLASKQAPVILLANKIDGINASSELWTQFLTDSRRLGFGEPVPFSAAQGEGLGDLHNALVKVPVPALPTSSSLEDGTSDDVPDGALCLAVLGRPNAGKSSLVNALIGQVRCVVSSVPGTTRDAVPIEWEYQGRKIRLVDTAGLRGGSIARALQMAKDKSKNALLPESRSEAAVDVVDGLAAQATLRSLNSAHVACVVIDLEETGLQDQPRLSQHDVSLIGKVLDAGKALIVVANKVDCVRVLPQGVSERGQLFLNKESSSELVEWLSKEITQRLPQLDSVTVILASALTKNGVDDIMPAVVQAERRWASRVPTHQLVQWVRRMTQNHPPPSQSVTFIRQRGGASKPRARPLPVKIKFASQVSSRPPTFALWVNRHIPGNALEDDYIRYLANALRKDFDLKGVPLRFKVKSSPNPYVVKQ